MFNELILKLYEYIYITDRSVELHADNQVPLPLFSPSKIIRNKSRGASQDKKVSFKIAERRENDKVAIFFEGNDDKGEKPKTDIYGIKKSEGSANIFSKFNQDNPPPTSSTTVVFGLNSQNLCGEDVSNNANNSVFSSSLNTGTASTNTKSEQICIFGNKTNFGSTANGANIFGGGNKENNPAAFTNTPMFGASIFGSVNNRKTSENKTSTNIFGSNSTFSFAEAAKAIDKSIESKTTANEPEFLKNINKMGGFAELAASSNTNTAFNVQQNNGLGHFFGLTVKDDFFSKNLSKQNTSTEDASQNDGDNAHDEYDPHYDPIISLPDEIKVSTGEEDEEKMFGERAKLFRYDMNTKEWKERGVGEIKILHHQKNKTSRMILRREQIFKLVLNQLITSELHMSLMENSPKAFCWAGMNYAESSDGEVEQLAIRFKNEELANNFKKVIEECQRKMNATEE